MTNNENYIDLSGQIYPGYKNPGMIFTDIENNRVPVQTIRLDLNSQIESLTDIYEEDIDPDTTIFQKEVLNVPGIGLLTPKTRVVWKEKDYVLLFGWHKNISNQEIYSWYLRSVSEDTCDKTLYKNMVDEIELIHFR